MDGRAESLDSLYQAKLESTHQWSKMHHVSFSLQRCPMLCLPCKQITKFLSRAAKNHLVKEATRSHSEGLYTYIKHYIGEFRQLQIGVGGPLLLYTVMSCSSRCVVRGGDGPCGWVLSARLTPVEWGFLQAILYIREGEPCQPICADRADGIRRNCNECQ